MGGKTCIYYGSPPAYTSGACPGVTPPPATGQTVVVDPLGHKTTYQFDTAFRTTQVTDALSGTVDYAYDSNNNLLSVTDQADHTTSFTYDARGNVTRITDPLFHDWTFAYTAMNDIDLETDPRGNMTDYGYDASGNLTSVTRKDSGGTPLATTTLTRAPSGNGDLTAITDANSHTTAFTYDSHGLLDTVDGPLTGSPNDLTDYDFDAGGRLTSVTDANSNTTSFQYDAQSNVTQVTDALNQITTYGYDAKGSRTSVTNAKRQPVGAPETGGQCGANGTGNGIDDDGDTVKDDGCPSTRFTYWDDDRLHEAIDALGRVTTYLYDPAGSLESRTDGLGLVTEYVYDEVNRLTDANHWNGETLVDTVHYDYYADGLRESMDDSTGTTSYEYFDNHQLENVTDPLDNVVQYTYDPAGNRDTITYPGTPTKTVTYTFDEFDRMKTVTDWLDNVTTYEYESVGNLKRTTYPAGTGLWTDYTYDAADRLTAMENNNAGGTISSFSYALDAVGNRTQVSDNTGVADYGYDDVYRLRAELDPDSHFYAYGYDGASNRQTWNANLYQYDAADQMSIGYVPADSDGDGCVDEEELGSDHAKGGLREPDNPWDFYDVPAPTLHDGGTMANRDRAVTTLNDALALLRYSGTTDDGPPNSAGVDYDDDRDGDGIEDGRVYDRSLGRAVDTNGDTTPDLTLSGPPNGFITILEDVLLVLAQGANDCHFPPNEAAVSYGYDDNGNQTGRGSDSFTYDHDNRLTQAVIGGNTSTYAYNGDGLRASRTAGGVTANYVWDVAAGLPTILQETAAGHTTYYVYGLDLIASVQGSTATYFLTDGLGSTTGLANGGGTVTDTYRYDAFGAIRTSTGSSTQPFRFTGEQLDSQTGMYYLRARYYDPALGRFITQDPWPGSAFSPLTLSPYAYVLNSPMNWIDPWGLRNLEGIPTPTPAGMIQACVGVGPGHGCREYGPWMEIPHGGQGWALFPAIKELLAKSSGWFNNTCPGQVTKTGIGTAVGTVGFGGAITPGFEWLSPLLPAGYKIVFGGPPGQPPLEACR